MDLSRILDIGVYLCVPWGLDPSIHLRQPASPDDVAQESESPWGPYRWINSCTIAKMWRVLQLSISWRHQEQCWKGSLVIWHMVKVWRKPITFIYFTSDKFRQWNLWFWRETNKRAEKQLCWCYMYIWTFTKTKKASAMILNPLDSFDDMYHYWALNRGVFSTVCAKVCERWGGSLHCIPVHTESLYPLISCEEYNCNHQHGRRQESRTRDGCYR